MKVLLISHNPLSTYNGMGKTMMSLFSSFDKAELCQLYIYPTVPDTDMCGSYYRITDKDVLRFYPSFRVRGKELYPDLSMHQMFENSEDEPVYRSPKNKKSSRILARDLMWKLAKWYNRDLEDWLRREAPTVIWVAPGISGFLYDIALKISRKFSLPIVTYICDDYYFTPAPKELWGRTRCALLRRKIRKLMQNTSRLVVISPELKEAYEPVFSLPADVIMTGSTLSRVGGNALKSKSASISFFGNIRCDRYRSLADVGRALDEINREKTTAYRLKIYSEEKNAEILSAFDGIGSIELCDFLTGDAFDRAISCADYLLHVEAFDEGSIAAVRYSVSTKIADSLASGVPLIAYGPSQIASMQHLIRNRCALTVLQPAELKSKLLSILVDPKAGEAVVKNALAVAQRDHCAQRNSEKMRDALKNAEQKGGGCA